MRHRFTATHSGPLDKLIADQTPLSRKHGRKILEAGGVRVDGQVTTFATHSVIKGAVVEVRVASTTNRTVEFEICHRDDSIIVINKPAGVPTQATRQDRSHNLYSQLQSQEKYVGLHHRLDTPTSGLVLFTIDQRANQSIAEAFRTHKVERTYQLVVVGDPGESGTWTEPIDGKSATTRFRRLHSKGGMSLLEATLETGRTHQIRIHAAEAANPVVGDRRHGGAAGRLWSRLALHANRLSFVHPMNGKTITIKAPIPADLMPLWVSAGWVSEPQCSPETAVD
jgi:23S rRNA pseudouridine1911/1915/1917 synthase